MTTSIISVSETESKIQVNGADALSFNSSGDIGGIRSINGGQLSGFRNKIINGNMLFAQRGASFAALASTAYGLDRWQVLNTSAGVVTISQQSDVPSSNEFQFSHRAAVTTADTSIAAGDLYTVGQRIEGYNVRDLIGRTFTLSFWVRSIKTGTHCVGFRNSGADRSYIVEYTISSANTWEYKTVTVANGLITAGTWDWTNGNGLLVNWALAVGSTFQTTANAWQTGQFYATSNQVNCLDTIGNIFAITGVQLEVGSVATPFEHRPYGMELALCQRYYELVTGTSVAARPLYTHYQYKVTKRATPTLSIAAGSLAGADFYSNGPSDFRCPNAVLATVAVDWALAANAEL